MATKKTATTEAEAYQIELDIILAEVKKGKEDTGRPIKISVETYKAFWFYYLQTRMVEWSCDKANISEQTWRTLKQSPYFQRLISLRGDDLKAVAMINLSKNVRGREATYDKDGNMLTPAVPGSIEDSKWLLSQVYQVGKPEEGGNDVPIVGAPRNEEEAKLMAQMLNWHYEYRNKQSSGGGSTTQSQGTAQTDSPSEE